MTTKSSNASAAANSFSQTATVLAYLPRICELKLRNFFRAYIALHLVCVTSA